MFGFMRAAQEEQRLKILEQELASAHVLGKRHCVRCGFCCHKRTCIPTPTELRKIAKFLKMTPQALIDKYYAIDELDGIYHVKPLGKNIKDLAGKFIPNDRTYNEGKCVFLLKNNVCKIYSVRPRYARETKCWDENALVADGLKTWKRNALKREFGIDVATLVEEAGESYDDE
jgi:Fe-S-cluster containining protein